MELCTKIDDVVVRRWGIKRRGPYVADRITPPLLAREGVAARVRRKCEASEAAQTGWWFKFKNISV